MHISTATPGRLTPTGIAYDEARTALCFTRYRRVELSYKSILSVEQFQVDHYLVKFVNPGRVPHFVDEMLFHIPDATTSARQSDDVGLLEAGESAGDSGSANVEALIFARAYANKRDPRTRKPVLVLINPKSGPGHAERLYHERSAPVFAAAGLKTNVVVTQTSGEATRLAQSLSMEEYDTLVLVSGDGLPHEVLQGLANRGDESARALKHFALCQLPGGSGNAMSLALNQGEKEWAQLTLSVLKGQVEPHDIMAVSQGDQTYYSFLSQSYGVVADCDLGTEHLRWMGGSRFIVGLVYKVLRGQSYPCEVAYKEGSVTDTTIDTTRDTTSDTTRDATSDTTSETMSDTFGGGGLRPKLSVNDPIPSDWTRETHMNLSMFYVGKMDWMSADALMFPRADSLDGSMDLIMWDTSFGWFRSLSAFASVETGNHIGKIPSYKKIQAYRLTPLVPDQYLSIDGESYPVKPFQVTVLPAAASFIKL